MIRSPSIHSESRQDLRELAALSFLTLFLELALIRYLGAGIWNLSYFPNFVLLSAMNGLGLGFLFHSRLGTPSSNRLTAASAWILLSLLGLVAYWHPAVPNLPTLGGEIGGELFFSGAPVLGRLQTEVAFPLVFLLVLLLFLSLGQAMARRFRDKPPLVAYTVNIAGSCAGVIAFGLLSWIEFPPTTWFAFLLPLYWLALRPRPFVVAAIALGACLVLVHAEMGTGEVTWSPYQKVQYVDDGKARTVFVNGMNHQSLQSIEDMRRSWYPIPHLDRVNRHLPPFRNALVLGAGTGNDVAAALASGAEHVDAVEIDPVIANLGGKYHPARPYRDPRVHLHVEDGRNFLGRAKPGYDLILFALTDSVVKLSPVSQLRLENYLFTFEAVRRARELLAPGGEIVFYNFYRQPWLTQKIADILQEATGTPARVLPFGGFTILLDEPLLNRPAKAIPSRDTPSDDWPFLYLKTRGIPSLYSALIFLFVGLLVALAIFLKRTRATESPAALSFFFLGIAFLLLETKSVTQFSLVFGMSWWNNSLVILGVLLLVLLANLFAPRVSDAALLPIVAALFFFCFLGWWVPTESLLAFSEPAARLGAAIVILFSPVFFANLLFSVLFRNSPYPGTMLGWNLLGSALGGILEYGSMLLGYRTLGLLTGAFYALAVLFAVRARRTTHSPLRALALSPS